tara:strand:- start:5 stop:469 length:465 start_codon:yes stop_codon:yes gene_type:complete
MGLYDYTVTDVSGNEVSMREVCEGNVVLITNTASECGWTRHYEPLQELYEQHKGKGFVVIAFPCNQFGEQEPGSNEMIREFCETKYNVTFPIMEKNDVQGETAQPVWQWLVAESKAWIGWNFHKFVIDRSGNIVGNWEMEDEMEPVIECVSATL